ncbi:uncharacterized protein LOC136086395 [Hydra vulgaris]|uniref:Uncharacterized protein LOC136086395 n=1 Tax=Hydra vulgaris TaxID=6087 RepID=A0ABM4CS89_HYDVU
MIYHKEVIIEKLNNFFLDVGPNLAAKIPVGQKKFDSYLATTDLIMEEPILTKSELHTAFNSLKKNKSAGIDQINVNVIKSVFDIVEPSLFHIFNLSLKSGHIPDKLKIAKITPIFKSGDETNISNYRPISVLPCFSKLIERIILLFQTFEMLCESTLWDAFEVQGEHIFPGAVILGDQGYPSNN